MGPAGVGKSAVAQTIAEEFKDIGQLGAALFFSRLGHRDDPDGVIATLAYQLAVKHPGYKRIITQRLADDPTILERSRRTQFKELIIEPFQLLMTQNTLMAQEPLLIVLDGLDECKGDEAQCELIDLISTHVRQVESFPLLWLICSRPEWHLKYLLSEADFQITCTREELSINDDEAQRDVALVLRDGFKKIKRRYRDRLEPNWPPEEYLRRISVIACGLFAFACTIIRFVGDKYRGDPGSQLVICIRFLGGESGMPGAINPLHALDLLYRQILAVVPEDVLPIALRILGFSITYPRVRLSAQNQAKLLCIDQASFYRSLQGLHSVVDVPCSSRAHTDGIGFYHTSFGDYLSDPRRSGPFSIDPKKVHYDVAVHALRWQSRTQVCHGKTSFID